MEQEPIFTRVSYTDKEEWLKERSKGIGGSDAGIILGFNSWTSNAELWDKKVKGEIHSSIDENNERIVYGHTAEDYLRGLFQAKFVDSLKVSHTEEILVRNDKNYLRASLDGEIEVIEDVDIESANGKTYTLKKGQKGIWENKTSKMPKRDVWDKHIPQTYLCQILHYLNVTGWDFVILSVEITFQDNSSYIKHFVFKREEYLPDLKYLEKEEDNFWKHVMDKEPLPLKIKL